MPLVQAKCTNCGGILQVENDKDAAICPFCQTPYIVEKAINNFNISNQISIKDSEVHIHGGLSLDEKYENADNFLTVHKDYSRAEELFEELVRTNPNDYRGWWGVVRAKTKELSFYGLKEKEVERLISYANSSFKVCDNDILSRIKPQWESFKKTYDDFSIFVRRKDKLISNYYLGKHEASRGTAGLVFCILISLGGICTFIISLVKNAGAGGFVLGIIITGIGLILSAMLYKPKLTGRKKMEIAKKELEIVGSELEKIDPDKEMEKAYLHAIKE